METSQIVMLVTVVTTWFLGYLSKKSKFINNNLIPVQNLFVGVIVAIIEWIITGDFDTAIALSGLFAGGAYDLSHNLQKIAIEGK